MDSWGNDAALYLLVGLVPLVVALVWAYRSRRRRLARMGPLAPRLANEFSPAAWMGRAVLVVCGFGLLILSAARNQEAGEARQVQTRGIDVVIALDISKSMLAQDVRPSRLERAKAELGDLAKKLRGHRFALVAFAGAAFVQCPLTTDIDALRLFLRALDPKSMPIPGTSLSRALSTSLDLLKDPQKKRNSRGKAIVLITDGEGHDEDPKVEAKLAKEKGVVLHTVGIGTAAGAPVPEYDRGGRWAGWKKNKGREVLSTLNPKLLDTMSKFSGGKFFHVGPGGAGMADLTKELDKLTKGQLESELRLDYKDRYEWFLFPAFLFFLVEAVLSDKRRRRAAPQEGAR